MDKDDLEWFLRDFDDDVKLFVLLPDGTRMPIVAADSDLYDDGITLLTHPLKETR